MSLCDLSDADLRRLQLEEARKNHRSRLARRVRLECNRRWPPEQLSGISGGLEKRGKG